MIPNQIPKDRGTIVMPMLTERAGGRWHRVDGRAPAYDRRAAVLAAHLFRDECGYDFPMLNAYPGTGAAFATYRDWRPGDPGDLFALAYVEASPQRHYRREGWWVEAPAWVICRQPHDGRAAEVGVIWVHPHHRGRGLLTQEWPAVTALLGTPDPVMDKPLSRPMARVLDKVRRRDAEAG